MKKKLPYLITLLTPILGVLSFFVWWAGLAFFAIDMYNIGFWFVLWIATFFLLCFAAFVVFLALFLAEPFTRRMLMILILILANIPAIYLVGEKRDEIQKRAYVRFENQTKHDNLEIIVKGPGFEKNFGGGFDDGESEVGFYYPVYIKEETNNSLPELAEVTVTFKQETLTHTHTLPGLNEGECGWFMLDEEFRLHRAGR